MGGGQRKVKSYVIHYHKLIVSVHTAVADKKRSKELSSHVIVHIWLPVCVCMSEIVVKLYPKRTKKKFLLQKASSFLCGGVCRYPVVNVNLPGLFFRSPTQITLKTEQLGIEEPCGGWVVCRSGRVSGFPPQPMPSAPPVHQTLPFWSFASLTARSRGRRGYAHQASFFWGGWLF